MFASFFDDKRDTDAPGNGYKTTWKRLENECFVTNNGVGRKTAWTFTAKINGPWFDYYFAPESGKALLPGFNVRCILRWLDAVTLMICRRLLVP